MLRHLCRVVAILPMLCSAVCAHAADLKVLSAGAVAEVLERLAADFTRQTGQNVVLTVGTAGQIRGKIEQGEPTDLVVIPTAGVAALEKSGKVLAGSRTDLGRVGLGVAVREGAASPDISTPTR